MMNMIVDIYSVLDNIKKEKMGKYEIIIPSLLLLHTKFCVLRNLDLNKSHFVICKL
jgi:hypothetical protein